jgi:hypothetical protein
LRRTADVRQCSVSAAELRAEKKTEKPRMHADGPG